MSSSEQSPAVSPDRADVPSIRARRDARLGAVPFERWSEADLDLGYLLAEVDELRDTVRGLLGFDGDAQVPFPMRKRRTDRTRVAVDRALRDAPAVGLEQITAELARSTAQLVDSAKAQQDPRLFMQASDRLLKLLDRIGGRPARAGSARAGDDLDDDGDDLAAALDEGPA